LFTTYQAIFYCEGGKERCREKGKERRRRNQKEKRMIREQKYKRENGK
jgi:hypothetical protein